MTSTASGNANQNAITEATDPYVLSDAASTTLLARAPWQRYAVMGDSVAAGTGDPTPGYETIDWAGRVSRVLTAVQPELAFLNTATPGLTIDNIVDSQLDRVLSFKPDLVHVSAGGNDLWVADPDLDKIEDSLSKIFQALAHSGAQITTFTLTDVFTAPQMAPMRDRVESLNSRTRRVASTFNATVIDMWQHPIRTRPDLLSADKIHYAMGGRAVLATEVIKALATLTRDSGAVLNTNPLQG